MPRQAKFVFSLVLIALLTGCGSPESAPPAGDSETSAQDPAGPSAQAGDSGSPPAPAVVVGIEALRWTTPDGWQRTKPSTMLRHSQYRVPGPAGDAECAVFYFGPGQGGDAMQTALEWAGQFTQADGSSANDLLQTREMEVHGIQVLVAEISGTYDGGALEGEPKKSLPGHMLLGAIASGPDANWFFKLTGPAETVEANRQAFEETLIGSLEGEPRG